MDQTTLTAQVRENTGKGIARRLRAQKQIPAVLYGPHMDKPMGIAVDPKALRAAVQGPRKLNTILTLDMGEAGKRVALLKDFQKHPVTGELLHADFYEVHLDKPIRVSVPVILEGRPEGVTLGGILSQTRRNLTVECLPDAIPDRIVVDVTRMKMGEALHVADIQPPEGVRIRYVNNFTVAVVTAPEGAREAAAS
jgi:large subunit ribosomal protein L25